MRLIVDLRRNHPFGFPYGWRPFTERLAIETVYGWRRFRLVVPR